MENVSNALLLSATMLVFLILIGIGAYLYTEYGSYSKNINDDLLAKQQYEFNKDFIKLNGIETCRAHDVITIANLAKENNNKYLEDYPDADFAAASAGNNLKANWPYYISVKLSGCDATFNSNNFERKGNDIFVQFMKENDIETTFPYKAITFTCKVHLHEDINRVYLVEFEKNT